MGLFDEVKENVTVRQAAELYGFKITKSGLISCIFHNDKTPSMKVDRRYYCFSCGVTGDVIDFTAQLFGLSLKEAALKLADDFGIQISRVDRRKIKKPRKILKSKPEKNLVKSEEQEYIECVRAMLDYRILLQKWKKEFAPKSPEEEWDEKFVEALKYLTIVEYYLDQFYLYFEVYYGLGNEKNLYKALQIEAANRAYHPICEYLETLKWDGEERIRYVLKKYMGADDSDYVYEVLKHFMMEALLRVFYPGIKADEMLCLVGQQGAGKSTFFRFLCLKDNWFSDDLRDLGDKKVFESIRGHWIIEMSEMIAAISAKSNEEIKSFLSRQKDTYRTAYARFEKDRKRQCVFAGSTNTYQFIPFDRTGARRFLPIMIDASKAEKHILDDEEEARAYFNQLWAEAMIIYHNEENKGNLLKFTKEMQKEIDEYRKQFMQEDTLAGTIQGWLDNYKGNYVCSIQIWSEAFNHGDREPKKYETNEICQIMDTQIIGWKRGGYHRYTSEGYGRQRCWTRKSEEIEGGNEIGGDGFRELSATEQMELPFH